MEERRLNLSTPLLSVRRNLSSATMNAASLLNGRTAETPRPRNQPKRIASEYVDQSMDQITELVSVPFTWEEVPGKAKDDGEPELLPSEETVPPVPVIATRNSSRIHDDCSEKELKERSQTKNGFVTDEGGRYSDAVDTLSPTNSFSVSYSISSLGESDGTVMKPSGTFSIDTQTRDFMMGRFLPAARALAIASESSLYHASRKPHLLLTKQFNEVEKPQLLAIESGTPSRQHNMEVVKYCTQALCQTESSEEEEEGDDHHSEYGTVTEKGCGLLPQLCIGSSLRLLNPVPGIKSKIKNSMPFVPAIRKDLKDESMSPAIFTSSLPQPRSEQQVKTLKLEVGEMKAPGWSNRHSFSGELQRIGQLSPFRSRRNDVTILDKSESPQPAHPVPPIGGTRRLSLSGELHPTLKVSPFRSSMNDAAAISEKSESPRPPHVVPTRRGSNRFSLSGELQTTSRLSPFRSSRNDNVPSEKGESPRSSDIGLPLGKVSQHNFSSELRSTCRLSPFRPSRNEVVNVETKESSQLSYTAPPLGESRSFPFRPSRNEVVNVETKESSRLSYMAPPFRESSRHRTSRLSPCRPPRNDVVNPEKSESPRPSYVVPPRGGLSRYNFSGELRMAGRSSPFRLSRDDVMISEKKESTQPSYVMLPIGCSGGRYFSGEMQTQHRQSPLRPLRNQSRTLKRDEKKDVPTLNKANGCIRPVSPAFERTLYVDTVNAGCDSCSNLNVLEREVWMYPMASRGAEETSTGESSFQDIECLDIVSRDQTLKEVDDGVVDPSSTLPLPLLKSPSESWLWRTLPSKSDRSLFSSVQKKAPPPSKNQVPDAHMPDAKWETIVKTSKTHHDHTRYSEELINHALQRYKS